MKVLFLDTGFDSTSDFFRTERENVDGCINKCLYKNQKRSVFDKLIQCIGIYVFSPILYLIYGDWKKELNKYDMFIIASRKSSGYAAKYIRKKTGKRVVIWYWNLVTPKELDPEYCRSLGCETWSFDRTDCKKYKMMFGDTYYFPLPNRIKSDMEKKYSLFYVGINRPGREEILNKIGEILNKENLSYKFNLTAIPTEPKEIRDKYDKRLSYDEVIEYILKSDAILDLNREKQSGMTLRPLEAIFFQKKLITNNKHISEYRAYSPENTYILNDNNYLGIIDFLKKDYVSVDSKVIEYYSFKNWFERICNCKQADDVV